MSKFLILLITILNLNKIKAQDSLLFGNCIKSPVISDFNIEKYTGKWFGIEEIRRKISAKDIVSRHWKNRSCFWK